MSWEEAAAFPINYLTAYFCLFDLGNLRSFQTILIPSAAGNITIASNLQYKSEMILKLLTHHHNRWSWMGSHPISQKYA